MPTTTSGAAGPDGEVLDIASLSEEEREKYSQLVCGLSELSMQVWVARIMFTLPAVWVVCDAILTSSFSGPLVLILVTIAALSNVLLSWLYRRDTILAVVSVADEMKAVDCRTGSVHTLELTRARWSFGGASKTCVHGRRDDVPHTHFLVHESDWTLVTNLALETPGEETVVSPGPKYLVSRLAIILVAATVFFGGLSVFLVLHSDLKRPFSLWLFITITTMCSISTLRCIGIPYSIGLTTCVSTPEELRVHSLWKRTQRTLWSSVSIDTTGLDFRSLARIRITSPTSSKPLRILVTQEGLNTVLQHARAAGATITTRERKPRRAKPDPRE